MSTEPLSVNVEDGFYPLFAESFREHYGAESVFVRALADQFTASLARILDARGRLADGTIVAILGAEDARHAVDRLLRAVPSIRITLFQEALGAVPLGSYSAALDGIMGTPIFDRWLASIQAGDYEAANQSLPDQPESGGVSQQFDCR